MPELPDVETFRTMVQRAFNGGLVSNVIVSDPGVVEKATTAAVLSGLRGGRLDCSGRHGKYLFVGFDHARVLIMHFGPAGSLHRVPAGQQQPAYVRFRLDFSNGDGLAYVNRRRLGRVRLVGSTTSFIEQARLGPDALENGLGIAAFAGRLAGRRQPIKVLLTDQSRLAGIGNTYSDEILFQARIHPADAGTTLDAERTRRLFRSMRSVLRTAIDLDPTTDDFRMRLPARYLLPHRHKGGHCPRCGTALERERLGGHMGTYCPHCQKPAAAV